MVNREPTPWAEEMSSRPWVSETPISTITATASRVRRLIRAGSGFVVTPAVPPIPSGTTTDGRMESIDHVQSRGSTLNDTTKQIGFVGATGLMGHGLAKNILLKGYPLAYTMRQRAPEGLDELGATRAADNAELGRTSDIVVICVTSAADVEQVVTELLTDPKPGLIIMDASTSEPSMTRQLNELAAGKGARIADIPLTRGPAEAEAGTVNVLVGADDDLYAEIEPIIKCFADNIYRCGGVGAGHIIKLLNNTAFQAALTILAEGFAIAVKMGVDPQKLTEVLSGGGFANGGTLKIMENSLNGDFETLKFQLDNARKDVRYYTRMAAELSVPAMVGDGVHEALATASALGFGGEFCAALTKSQAKLNDITIVAGEPEQG